MSSLKCALVCRMVLLLAAVVLGMVAPATAQPVDLATELTEARRIFVPSEDLDVVVERDHRGALLTNKRFQELLALARANAAKGSTVNLPIVLTGSQYQARVVGDQLLLSVTAELSQFVSDWQSVTMPMQRLSVEQATLDDQPAKIGRNGDGSISLLNDTKGTHTLKLELSTELGSQGSDQVAAFSLLRAPSGLLLVTLPAGKRLLVGSLQLERPAPLDKPADYQIAVGGAPGMQLRITDRAAENAADALTFATTGYGLHVAPGEVTWHALTTLQIFGKPVDRLTFSVPSTVEIADIEATGLESWDLADDPNDKQRTKISLTFGQAFDGSRKISFKGVMAVEAGKSWAVPPLFIANVTSHIGQVVVQHPAGVRLRVEDAQGVRRATQGQKPTADMPDDMAKMNATEFLRFDVWQPDFLLRLTTQPKEREIQTAVAAVLDVNATGLDLQSLITMETHFAPLFELDVRLPADWTVISIHRDDKPLKWQMTPLEAGLNQLRILLDPSLAAETSGTVRLSLRREVEGWPVEADPIIVALPELYLPQSNLSEGAFVVRGDDDLDLAALDMTGLDTVPLKADFERLRFQSQDTRYGGKLKVTRKPSRIAVQTITVGRLDPQTMHAFLQAMIEVQGGGVRILRVAMPESAGTSVRFHCPIRQIVEQKPGDVQNGERIWTLQLDQRVRGVLPLFCDLHLPRGEAKEFRVPQARFVDAERQNGFLVAEAGGEQRLTIDARGADGTALDEIDPLDLPDVYYVPKERVVAVYRNVTAGATMTLSEERLDKLAVPSAVCPVLNVTSVLGRTGELQHRATFQLTAVGIQGLRVTLPSSTSLWATLVDGQPVEVRRQGDVYLVPLGMGHAGPARQLQLFYRSQVFALNQFGTLEQPPPELSVQTGQGTSQPVDVLDQRWDLHYPATTLLVSSNGPLEPEQPLDNSSLLGRINAGIAIPTLAELGWQVFAVILTLGVIGFFLVAYRRGISIRLTSVVAILMFGMFGLVTIVILLPAIEEAREQARRTQSKNELRQIGMALADYHQDGEGWSHSLDKNLPSGTIVGMKNSSDAKDTKPRKQGAKFLQESAPEKGKSKRIVPATDRPPAPPQARSRVSSELPADVKRMDDSKSMGAGEKQEEFWKFNLPERKEANEQLLKDRIQPADQAAVPFDPLAQNQPKPNQAPARPGAGERDDAFARTDNDELALLSLAIELEAPAGSRQKTFRYAGADPARGGIALELGYVDEQSGRVLRVFLVALIALVGWFLRGSSCATKTTLAALGLTLPLALAPLAPQSLQVALDGLFYGVIAACGLWLVVGIAPCLQICCSNCCGWRAGKGTGPDGTTVGLWLLAAVLLSGTIAQAQQKGPSPPQQPEKPASPTVPVSPSPAGTTLVVPFDAGDDPLAADKILLPIDKFLELYRQAYPDQPAKRSAPDAGGVVQALYSARIIPNAKTPDESTVEVTAKFAVRSYVDGQLQVELPVRSVAAREAKLDGQNAALTVSGDVSKVTVSTPGLHVIDFVFSVPARLSGSTGTFTLPLNAAPSGKLSFALPAKDLAIRINGSSTIFRKVTRGEAQLIEIPVDKGGDLVIAWQPEQAKGAAAAVVHVDSVQAISLTDAGTLVSTGFQYKVRQSGIADVTFSLPAAYRLQSVNGGDVGGWELQGEDAARKLKVVFRRNITDTTQLTVEAFLDAKVGVEATVIDIPQLAPKEVTNEIGQVAVFAGDQFSLRADKVESLTQVDAGKFATTAPVSRPGVAPQLAYRFSRRPFTLSLRATRQESQAHVTAMQAAFVTRHKQQLTTRLIYQLTGAPRSSFQIALPAGFVVLDVKGTGLHDWSLGKQDDDTTLTIDLNAPRLGLAEVVLSGIVPRDDQTASASLSFPRPLGATRLVTTSAVWLDEGFSATLDTFDGWRSVDAALVSDQMKAVRPNHPVQFAFQSTTAAPSAITFRLFQAAPKLTANGLTMVSVTDVAVINTLALQWKIDAATTDSLVFTTPNFLAGKLEFTGAGIRETTHVDAGNGRTRWTIWLRTPISGRYFATAIGTLPPATTDVQAPSVVFERDGQPAPGLAPAAARPTSAPVDGQRQYVLLINLSQSQLTSASPELTEDVQREDVPVVVDQSLVDQATELVRVKQLGTAPRWTLQKFSQTASAPASVNVADLTTIVSRDGTYRGRAIYTIKNRSRQFLAIKLPANAELMSVFVGAMPSRAVTTTRNKESVQLIALPKTSAASLSFPVQVIWRGSLGETLPKSARVLRQAVDLPGPVVIGQQDASFGADFGIPVAKSRWTVWLPDDLDVQPVKDSTRHNMTLQESDQRDLLYEKAAVQELSELLGFVEQNYNFNSKGDRGRGGQPATNMKQIGLALDNVRSLEQAVQGVDEGQDQEFARQKDLTLKRLSDLQQNIQADQAQAKQPVAAQTAGTPTVTIGNSSVAIQGNASQLDTGILVQSQTNNEQLFLSNNGDGIAVQTDGAATSTFNFDLQNNDMDEKKDAASPMGKLAGKAANLETRQNLQLGNGINLDVLNSSINQNKAGGQPGGSVSVTNNSRGVFLGTTQPGRAATGTPESVKANAASLLARARQAMKENRFDEARQLAIEADRLKASYDLFDDRPELVLSDLVRIAGRASSGAASQPAQAGQPGQPGMWTGNPAGVTDFNSFSGGATFGEGTYLNPRTMSGNGVGYQSGYGQIGGFMPTWINQGSTFQLNAGIPGAEQDTVGQSIGGNLGGIERNRGMRGMINSYGGGLYGNQPNMQISPGTDPMWGTNVNATVDFTSPAFTGPVPAGRNAAQGLFEGRIPGLQVGEGMVAAGDAPGVAAGGGGVGGRDVGGEIVQERRRGQVAPMMGSPAWTQAGGLSLGFDLPTAGKKLVFSKAGGDPKLALAVRPQASIRWGLHLVWSAVWLAIGLAVAVTVHSASVVKRLSRQLPIAVAVLSVLGFIVLPSPWNGLAFGAFVIASLTAAWINRGAPKTA